MQSSELRGNMKSQMRELYSGGMDGSSVHQRSFSGRQAITQSNLNRTMSQLGANGERSFLNDFGQYNAPSRSNQSKRDELLVDAEIEVKVKSPTREDYTRSLNIIIERIESPSQRLNLMLTDDRDLKFLQILKISESDYMRIKESQGIKSDYQQFPDYLREFVSRVNQPSSSFYVQLTLKGDKESLLSIGEKGEFRDLIVLELIFRPANDDEVKGYLAMCLSKARTEGNELQQKNAQLYEDLQIKITECDHFQDQLKNFGKERDQAEDNQRNNYQLSLNQQRQEFLEKEKDLITCYEKEKRSLQAEFRDKETALAGQLRTAESKVEQLSNLRMELDSDLKEARSKIKILEGEYTSSKREADSLREERNKLETLKHDHERKIVELQARLAGLSDQLGDKQEMMDKNELLISQNTSTLQNYEQQLRELRLRIEKNDKKLTESFEEINKANKIIADLKNSINDKKRNIKMKSQVIIEQEKHIEEKKRDVDKLKKMNADIQNSFKDRELVESRLKSEIETLRSMLEASEKTIKDQKGMMQYLDKKLNDQQEMKIDTAYIPRFKPPPISNLQETKSSYALPPGGLLSSTLNSPAAFERSFTENAKYSSTLNFQGKKSIIPTSFGTNFSSNAVDGGGVSLATKDEGANHRINKIQFGDDGFN